MPHFDDYLTTLTAELRAHGVTKWDVERNHRHPRLYFWHKGRRMFYVMPSTAGDRRGHLNALSNLRRMMGVKRMVRKRYV